MDKWLYLIECTHTEGGKTIDRAWTIAAEDESAALQQVPGKPPGCAVAMKGSVPYNGGPYVCEMEVLR